MKKMFIILFSIYFILAIVNYSNIIAITKNIWPYFINIIIPSLLPLILLTNLFIKSGIFLKICKKFHFLKNPIIILITILSGTPSSLIFLNDLKKQNIINDKEKNLIFSSYGGISFSFLYSLTISFKALHGIYFLMIYYLGETLIYLLNKSNKKIESNSLKYNEINFNRNTLSEVIISSFKTIALILVTSLLFNYLFMLNLDVFNKLPLLCTFIEFSFSSFASLKGSNYYLPILIMLILSFTSLSVYFQIYYVDSQYDLVNHIKKRWLISTINSCLFFILFF